MVVPLGGIFRVISITLCVTRLQRYLIPWLHRLIAYIGHEESSKTHGEKLAGMDFYITHVQSKAKSRRSNIHLHQISYQLFIVSMEIQKARYNEL
jgi:hypothetical protein